MGEPLEYGKPKPPGVSIWVVAVLVGGAVGLMVSMAFASADSFTTVGPTVGYVSASESAR